MRSAFKALFIWAVCLLAGGRAEAQSWSGIINATRAENWRRSMVGVSGGIPSASYTQCGSTIAAYGTSGTPASPATINNALASCGSNQYVLLGPGTFWLSAAVTPSTTSNPKSNVALRGSGPRSTILEIFAGTPCGNGRSTLICATNANEYFGAGSNSANVVPPCGGTNSPNCFDVTSSSLAQGTTSLTIANVGAAGINNGDEIILDQGNDTSDTGGYLICDTISPTICHQSGEAGSGNGRFLSGLEYSQQQFVTVATGCASTCSGAGPFAITINQPIYANNWDGHVPIAGWFVKPVLHVGIENLTIDAQNAAAGGYNMSFYNCRECWVSNVASLNSGRSHVDVFQSSRTEIRDSYFYSTKSGASQSYGIECGEGCGSDSLYENNIFQQVAGPLVYGGTTGTVAGHNFAISDDFTPTTFTQFTSPSHDTADTFNLFEGNQMMGFSCDDIHGTANNVTYYRNWLNGRDWNHGGQPSQQTFPIEMNSYCRSFNIIGNVLGTPGYHMNYEQFPPTLPASSVCNVTIYELGYGGGICDNLASGMVSDDTKVRSTLMRWGNYDVVHGAVEWDATESSPGSSTYVAAQSTPSSHTLPSSFYLSAKPSWWGSTPWPAVGPDVSGGAGPGGFAYNIPAAHCYFSVLSGPTDGTGSALSFDANSCYIGGSPILPAPPTGLTAAAK